MNLHKNLTERSTGIILAADVATLKEVQELARLCSRSPEIIAVKVGFILGLRYGLAVVVNAIREIADLPVIYDHQKAGTDIPQMGKPFAAVCRDAGISGAIFFPQAGPQTLTGFVSAAFDANLIPIVGLVMTHGAYLKSEGGYIVDEAPQLMADVAANLRVTHFVLPGTKPEIVKGFAAGTLSNVKSATIMMPGIGSQGGSLKRAFQAARPHRRFAIIGSAIYGAKDPRGALETFIGELQNE